ncbi:hypothetical protein P8452_32478 [Trifolium repens]|nr:hypothetical protein P8452_32478 [Trifolium repens]
MQHSIVICSSWFVHRSSSSHDVTLARSLHGCSPSFSPFLRISILWGISTRLLGITLTLVLLTLKLSSIKGANFIHCFIINSILNLRRF